jgi:hypothetical protein
MVREEICEKFDAGFIGMFLVSPMTGNNVDLVHPEFSSRIIVCI